MKMRLTIPGIALLALISLLACCTAFAEPVVTNIDIVINRQDDASPTPIYRQYAELLDSVGKGDQVVMLQKYFRNPGLIQKIVAAAERGARVLGVHADTSDPDCETHLAPDSLVNCGEIFVRRDFVHHKNMAVHRHDGSSSAIVGSFNLRERHPRSPRAHTVLTFDVTDDDRFFPFYKAHALPTSDSGNVADKLKLTTERGGQLTLAFQPGANQSPLEFLANIESCESPLWMSYYSVVDDALGEAVFERTARLMTEGCEIRLMMDQREDNEPARQRLVSLGIIARHNSPVTEPMTLGHKLMLVRSGGKLHLSQSSANLNQNSHSHDQNLTAHLIGDFPTIEEKITRELERYWQYRP